MTDVTATLNTEPTPTEQTSNITKPTKEQLEAIRPHLYNSVLMEYRKFVNMLHQLPIKTESLFNAMLHLDTGMLWAKEAIHHADFVDQELQMTTTNESVKITPVPVAIDEASIAIDAKVE